MFSDMADSVNTSLGVHLFEKRLVREIENVKTPPCPVPSRFIILD